MKTALVFGSSGLIGNQLVDLIIKENNYNKIKLFVINTLNGRIKLKNFSFLIIILRKKTNVE